MKKLRQFQVRKEMAYRKITALTVAGTLLCNSVIGAIQERKRPHETSLLDS